MTASKVNTCFSRYANFTGVTYLLSNGKVRIAKKSEGKSEGEHFHREFRNEPGFLYHYR